MLPEEERLETLAILDKNRRDVEKALQVGGAQRACGLDAGNEELQGHACHVRCSLLLMMLKTALCAYRGLWR